MFLSPNVRALYKGAKLRLVDGAEGPPKRVAEATFVIDPFTATLASELGEDVRRHLYVDRKDEVRPELNAIDLDIRRPLQKILVRTHQELAPMAYLEPVAIGKCSADKQLSDKTGRTWLRFTFVLSFDLTTKEARNFCIDAFGAPLHMTFSDLQGSLLDAEVRAAARALPGAHKILDAINDATPEEKAALANMAKEVRQQRRRDTAAAADKGKKKPGRKVH